MTLVLDSLQVALYRNPLFAPVSMSVNPGETATIMGPSGCGKSTLLSAICGTMEPGFKLSGTIKLNDRTLNTIPVESRRVGILFQDDLLFPHLNVFGNLAFGLQAGLTKSEKVKRVGTALDRAGLSGFESRDIATLSGGQKARVSLLRTLLAEPEAILLDEPFNKLDTDLRSTIREFVFDQISELNIPALLVTHDNSDAPGGQVLHLKGHTSHAR